MVFLLLIILVLSVIYYAVRSHYKYWEKRGVIGPKPTFPVGNLGKSFLLKSTPGEIFTEIYNKYKDVSLVGLYRPGTPILLIRDSDLIKDITVKYFNHFRDNDIEVDKNNDPLFGRHPFVLRGEEWKTVRAQLTPGFTSGKMKWLYPYLESNSQKLIHFIARQPEATNGKGYEAKEVAVRLTLSNIAQSVFGVEAKCFEEENSDFRQLAKDFFSPGSLAVVGLFIASVAPIITKIINIRFTSKAVEKKLTDLVTQTLKYREDNNIVRNDFLQIMSQLKKTCKDYAFTDIDVTAHAAGFFGDGYETSSMVMSFSLFELAANPEVQSKLRGETKKAFEENNNSLPYEIVQALPYLDGVVNETLRMHPPVYALQKLCTENFTYVPKESTKPVIIEKGIPVIFPIHALQNDPNFFDNPEEFIPERFIGENKDNIKKGTFLPFGEGPRSCLGQRYGLLQIKVGLAYVLKNYELSVNKKTKLPLRYDPTNILMTPVGGLWLDFKPIPQP